MFARGLAEYREGKFDEAISTMRGDASRLDRPIARLVLAMALHQNGQVAEGRKMLAAAILSYNWRATPAAPTTMPGSATCFAARPRASFSRKLPAFRCGETPQDKDEGLALPAGRLVSLSSRASGCAVAGLYSEAFVAESKLAEDVLAANRYHAACGGVGGLRSRWGPGPVARRGTCPPAPASPEWLRQDLTWSGQRLDDGNAQTNARIRQDLQYWWGDPDLAGVHAKDASRQTAGQGT